MAWKLWECLINSEEVLKDFKHRSAKETIQKLAPAQAWLMIPPHAAEPPSSEEVTLYYDELRIVVMDSKWQKTILIVQPSFASMDLTCDPKIFALPSQALQLLHHETKHQLLRNQLFPFHIKHQILPNNTSQPCGPSTPSLPKAPTPSSNPGHLPAWCPAPPEDPS
jgi:hypothetical protein